MMQKHKVLLISAILGLSLWLIDTTLDFFFFYEGTFWELLILQIPPHEIYIRVIGICLFFIFGIVLERHIKKKQKAEDRIRHLNSVLLSIRNVNQLITQETDTEQLIEKACKNLTITRGYHNAFIALRKGERAPVILAGSGAGFCHEEFRKKIDEGKYPSCFAEALKTGDILVFAEPAVNCADCPLSTRYENHSAFSIQLASNGTVYGVLSVSVPSEFANDTQEKSLFRELAEDLAYGLRKIEKESEFQKLQYQFIQAQAVANIGSWEINLATRQVSATAEARRIYGLDAPELTVQDIQKIPLPEYRKMLDESLKNLISGTGMYDVEFKIKRPTDGNIIDIHSLAQYDPKNNRVSGTIQDVTARKEADRRQKILEEQLFQSQKMEAIGRLTGGIAHDFNNMLAIILGHTDMLLGNTAPGDPYYAGLNEIYEASIKARNLNRQLLAFGRKQILDVKVFDINESISNFEKLLRRIIGEDIDLKLYLATTPTTVKADITQMEQVLMNLAANARDAMPNGGLLTIETKLVHLDDNYASTRSGVTPGTYVMIGVSDNGVGIAPESIDKIFEPFYTTKGMDKGTGLGLATVYGIIKQLGGNVWVYSEPGQGTTFKIYLPYMDSKPKRATQPSVTTVPESGSATVLVVEDDPAVRKMVCAMLDTGGYDVIESINAEDAVLRSREHRGEIQLLLTDVIMPTMKGPEVHQHILAYHPEVKTLYMSGYTDNVITRQGILKEGISFIQKPFSKKGLLEKVSDILVNTPPAV